MKQGRVMVPEYCIPSHCLLQISRSINKFLQNLFKLFSVQECDGQTDRSPDGQAPGITLHLANINICVCISF